MRVLSWDVGIINLAYCLIDFKNEDDWKIVDWNIINLTNRDKIKCKICKKNPTYVHNIDGETNYYCKVHAKKVDEKILPFDNCFVNINSDQLKCCCLFKKEPCQKKVKFQLSINNENLKYCNSHAKSEYKKMMNKRKLKLLPKKKRVGAISIDVLRIKLIEELEKRKNLLSANLVLIENQPTLRNPKMKAISSTIYDYYLIRGLFDKSVTKSNIEKVKYMSPSNKLKLAEDGDTKRLIKLKGDMAKTYKLTKSLGIKYCSKMIEPFNNWKEFFNGCKKKDDLADSFLQGMYQLLKS
tara:strand:+ start:956 stop:1843 length:888 start_codon:yes stop_codon:yes gene_type:complete